MYLLICGFIISIHFASLNKKNRKYYKRDFKGEISKNFEDYLIYFKPKQIDFTIYIRHINQKRILLKNKKLYLNFYEYEGNKSIVTYYWISTLEFSLILSDIIQKLLKKNIGFIFHASAVNINNEAYIFLGKSGSGKSTAADLLSKKYAKLADENLMIRKINGNYYLYQIPYVEKNIVKKTKEIFSLKRLYFIRKANYFKEKKIQDKQKILLILLKHLIISEKINNKNINNLSDFISSSPDIFSFLYFSKNAGKLIDFIEN